MKALACHAGSVTTIPEGRHLKCVLRTKCWCPNGGFPSQYITPSTWVVSTHCWRNIAIALTTPESARHWAVDRLLGRWPETGWWEARDEVLGESSPHSGEVKGNKSRKCRNPCEAFWTSGFSSPSDCYPVDLSTARSPQNHLIVGKQIGARTALCFQMVAEGRMRGFWGRRVMFPSPRWRPRYFVMKMKWFPLRRGVRNPSAAALTRGPADKDRSVTLDCHWALVRFHRLRCGLMCLHKWTRSLPRSNVSGCGKFVRDRSRSRQNLAGAWPAYPGRSTGRVARLRP